METEKVFIYEDSQKEVKLNKNEKEFLQVFKKQHEFTYNEKLSFVIRTIGEDDFFEPNGCVGLIKTPHRTIAILPRFGQVNFNNILRMWTYAKSSQQFDRGEEIMSYSFDYTTLLPELAAKFLQCVDDIVRSGLIGSYIDESNSVQAIRGKIDVSKSIQRYAINRLVYCHYENLSIDNILNQIILYCINLLRILQCDQLTLEVNRLSIFFKTVTLRQSITFSDFSLAWPKISRLTPSYGRVLRLCEMLVFNTFISTFDGSNAWYGFLIDYNYLFEDYIRKLLINRLGLNVGKWKNPKYFGSWIDDGIPKEKSYIPDILVEYNENSNHCRCVIDVKNKPTDSIFSNPDVFQLIFYCLMLQTKVGILVYPSTEERDVAVLEISLPNIQDKFMLFAVSDVMPINIEDFWSEQDRFVETMTRLVIG